MWLIAPIVAHLPDGVEAEEKDALGFLQEIFSKFSGNFQRLFKLCLPGCHTFPDEQHREHGEGRVYS
jgi:hypothetical protein